MGGAAALIFTAWHPNLVDGVSSQNGIADLTNYRQSFACIFDAIRQSYGNAPAECRKHSPVFTPEKFTVPVAITVGQKDAIAPPQTTLQLAEAMQKKGNRNVLVISRKDGGHDTNYDDTDRTLEFVIERSVQPK